MPDEGKLVVVLRGLPGSGKSTFIEWNYHGAALCSADFFFIRNGVYQFDPKQIGDAHAWCFRRFLAYLEEGAERVVVDNTNTSEVEIAPYMLAARAFGYFAKVVTIQCDPKVAAARNVHGVSEEIILKMNVSLSKPLPPWWEQEVVSPPETPSISC